MTTPTKTSLRDYARRTAAGELPLPPIMRILGCRIAHCGSEEVVLEMRVQDQFMNAMGTLHGGVFCDFADAAMGFALAMRLEDGASFLTIELKANYFRAVRAGSLRAAARIVNLSRTTCMLECDVLDDSGRFAARVSSTCLISRGEPA